VDSSLVSSLVVPFGFSLRECSPWVGLCSPGPASHLAIMRTIWSKWTRSWWSLKLVFRLLASDHKDQPLLPDHLDNLLIWMDSIKIILLAFAQYVPWAPSRSPTNHGYSHYFSPNKVTGQLICVHFTICTAYRTLCIYSHWYPFCLFRYSLSNCLVIDHLPLLIVINILYYLNTGNLFQVRYFDPVININIASQ
jgi:hypothetical protein